MSELTFAGFQTAALVLREIACAIFVGIFLKLTLADCLKKPQLENEQDAA